MINYKKNIMKLGKKLKKTSKKEFNSYYVYNEKYLKPKIKSYNQKINTNFDDNKKTKRTFLIYFLISNFDQSCF